jgi:NAD-dependent deacetylase
MLELRSDDRVFVLTGAGVSAESGIPTFRGAGGIWKTYRAEEVASPHAWARDPALVWEYYSMRRRVRREARPNPGHYALAQLEAALGERFTLVTQNVDNLHEQAGSKRVMHMHGELYMSRCAKCDRPPFPDEALYEPPTEVPRCACGGLIRPHVCWFGETPYQMDEIQGLLERCTVFLAAGTSGVVYPAAAFASVARESGARTFYVGLEAPHNAVIFDEVFLGKSGELLPKLLAFGTAISVNAADNISFNG